MIIQSLRSRSLLTEAIPCTYANIAKDLVQSLTDMTAASKYMVHSMPEPLARLVYLFSTAKTPYHVTKTVSRPCDNRSSCYGFCRPLVSFPLCVSFGDLTSIVQWKKGYIKVHGSSDSISHCGKDVLLSLTK